MTKNIIICLLTFGFQSQTLGQLVPPRILEHPQQIRLQKVDILNSTFRETNISVSPDGKYLYFMSVRGGQPWSSTFPSVNGIERYDGDLWYSKNLNGQWQSPVCLGQNINSSDGEDEPNISPDGQRIFFQSWGRPWKMDGGPYYTADLIGNTWSNAVGMGGGINSFFAEKRFATDGMTVSADGKIFIVACGEDYEGKMDLYISRKNAYGQWTDCERLMVSSVLGDERSPFLAPDGKTLYFASSGYAGWGGLDIFKTELKDDNTHGEIINLGAPFNTVDEDYGFVLTGDGTAAYFVRDGDIYYADVTEANTEMKPGAVLMLSGKVIDSSTDQGMEAHIEIKDALTDQLIADVNSNSANGEYSIILPNYVKTIQQRVYWNNFKDEIKELEFLEKKTGLNELNSIVKLRPNKNNKFRQGQTEIPKSVLNLDFSSSLGFSVLNYELQYMFALSASQMYGFGQKHKFQMGYGLRLNSYFGDNQVFKSAPPDLTTSARSADYVLASSQVNSLNAALHLQYAFNTKFDIGFNIDVIGFSFGSDQTGRYTTTNGFGGLAQSSPAQFNVLLIGANDYGSLNSEFFARYWFNDRWGIKLGINHVFVEFVTKEKIVNNENNNRFRNITDMLLIGVTYKPFNKKQ